MQAPLLVLYGSQTGQAQVSNLAVVGPAAAEHGRAAKQLLDRQACSASKHQRVWQSLILVIHRRAVCHSGTSFKKH